MPRIPTIFDDSLIDTFSNLFKTAQDPFGSTNKDEDPFNTATFDPTIVNRVFDNLLNDLRTGPAPTAENLETPSNLVAYLEQNNITGKDGYPIVSKNDAAGYELYAPGQYINVENLKTLLNQYKDAAVKQTNVAGQYFIHAIDNLISSLQSKPGFQDIGKADPKTVAPAQKVPEGQAATTTKPENPEQSGQQPQTAQQAAVINQVKDIHPLPPEGAGMFNVDTISAMMGQLLARIINSSIDRVELTSNLGTLNVYMRQIKTSADIFTQISPYGEPQFMVSGYDTTQTYQALNYMFNPSRAAGGITHADGAHFGSAAAAQAALQCQEISRDVGLFFGTLGQSSIGKSMPNLIIEQTRASTILQGVFAEVIAHFNRDIHSAGR